MDHWQRIIAAASEQCGQLWLPNLYRPLTVEACLEQQPDHVEPIVFEPSGDAMPPSLTREIRWFLLGPEGGWNDAEKQLFRSKTSPRIGWAVPSYEPKPCQRLDLHCAAGTRLAKLIGQPLLKFFNSLAKHF